MRVVNNYLVKKNRSVVSIVRPEGEQPAAAAPRKNK
jgi:hypothetical protein